MKRYFTILFPILFVGVLSAQPPQGDDPSGTGWPEAAGVVKITSSADGAAQPAHFIRSEKKGPQPLIVSLHSWSADYRQKDTIAWLSLNKGYHYIHPDFRGANNHPDAGGSELVIGDIDDAIDYVIQHADVDPDNIHIIGSSGGGHATLLAYMKSKHRIKTFTAFVPISNLVDWYYETLGRGLKYAGEVLKVTSSESNSLNVEEAKKRSPYFMQTPEREDSRLAIYCGVHDGYEGSVPITQSLYFYNKVVKDLDPEASESLIPQETIETLLRQRNLGEYQNNEWLMGRKVIYSNRLEDKVKVAVFEGKHEMPKGDVLSFIFQEEGARTVNGYRGIWFTLGQPYKYGDKYSGGLGTYTAKHIPLAIYSEQSNKTFFVFGGTPQATENQLLSMIGVYDHDKDELSLPVVVDEKAGVIDPHDNPSLCIDDEGYLWVFVSGRGNRRPGFKYKSNMPFSITDGFQKITEEEMAYPQPWYIPGEGFFHLFTKYTGMRELYYETSRDGITWSEDKKLSGIKEPGADLGGHYQVSNVLGNKVVTFFNRHIDGSADKRTDLYYLQTTDMGRTWQNAEGETMSVPLTELPQAQLIDYASQGKWVYMKDVNFDRNGNPICLYVTSSSHEPGPESGPREWKVTTWTGKKWVTHQVTTSDHNYDMGSLYIEGDTWKVVAPTATGPQAHQTGGDIEQWESTNQGNTWKKTKQLTHSQQYNHGYVRRPVNAHEAFYGFWADGNPNEFSQSYLYYMDKQGNVTQMPYEMKDEK